METDKTPELVTDDDKPVAMSRVEGELWSAVVRLTQGRSHQFHYVIDGQPFGGRLDIPVFLPASYEQPDVPQGKMSEKMVFTSKVYPGMQSDYWIYVPAQYDPAKPAALMIWQDGQGHIARNGRRTLNVLDNLTYQTAYSGDDQRVYCARQSGRQGDAQHRIRHDERHLRSFSRRAYWPAFTRNTTSARTPTATESRANRREGSVRSTPPGRIRRQFSRVLSTIGSFTSIQWHPGQIDGGNVYPNKIRKEAEAQHPRLFAGRQ